MARKAAAAIAAASLPMFMVSLNNLVVTNALPEIAKHLTISIADLQWVVNSYILAFAGLLLTASALGDRYGRRRVFLTGILLFSLGSVACALATTGSALIAARVLQGIGAAAIQPLSLTLVVGAVPAARRSAAIGLWGAVNGLGVALGPLVGGAVTEGLAWQWIFWINLPVAVIAVPLTWRAISESKGADRSLDLRGMVLVAAAVTLAVWGIVEAGTAGWGSAAVVTPLAAATALVGVFVWWERRAPAPLLPLGFYRSRAFSLSNVVSLAMFFGVFGSIFFLAQYMQGALGYGPLEAGLRTLPWTAMPMIVAPIAGALIDRVGGARLMAIGLALQGLGLAWITSIATVGLSYPRLVPALAVAGVGMGLVFAPTMAVVLASVRPHEHGKASGANNTVREVGGALGVAVLTAVFQSNFVVVQRFPFDSAAAFVDAMKVAIWVGVAVVEVAAVLALFIPPPRAVPAEEPADTPAVAEHPELAETRSPR